MLDSLHQDQDGGVKERRTKDHDNLVSKLCGMANNLHQPARKPALSAVTYDRELLYDFLPAV